MMEGYHHLTDSSQDKEVDVVRLKKYGCGLRISLVVSCLSWQGLFLSLLGFAASIFVLLLPRILHFQWDLSRSIIIYIMGTLIWLFSLLFFISSYNLMRKNKALLTKEVKEMVRTHCRLIGLLQILCGLIFLAYNIITVFQSQVKIDFKLASKIVCMMGSVALVTFSILLLYGIKRKKTKPILAAFIFNLFMEMFLVLTFSILSAQTGIDQILYPIMYLAVSVIHATYANPLILVHYNYLLIDSGYYEKNLEFFNRNFNFQI